VSPHQLRHGLGERLRKQGLDLGVAQQLLGHARPATTLRYGQPTAAEAELGLRLPVFLGALSTQSADGGFGPGKGLWSLETLVDEYKTLRAWQRELADEHLAAPDLLPITAPRRRGRPGRR
jgi:hypothetical protein